MVAEATDQTKFRLLVFIVAYNAERTIASVLARIPVSLADQYEVEILAIDDSSRDRTFEVGHSVKMTGGVAFPLRVLFNPKNQGYGGNQKIGYHYAIRNGFDFVALIHGDGQYAPEVLPELLKPLQDGQADAVFGSRMLWRGAALKGGMPLYKFAGNKVLTWFQNRLLRTNFSEFHSGYRLYSVPALKKLPFDRNTNDFHFDTEIMIQLLKAKMRIRELPIPTYYGNEICHVNGMKYAWNIALTTVKSRAHELGIFYDSKFDCETEHDLPTHYELKLGYKSPHTATLDVVAAGATVLDLGCAGGYMSALLQNVRGCKCTAVDRSPIASDVGLKRVIKQDLNAGLPDVNFSDYDYVLLLDVIEHLATPEAFIGRLRQAMKYCTHTTLIVSTANIGFFVERLMLLFGQFNYGKRGILDLTHTRLFTFSSLRRLLEQNGFKIKLCRGIPAPYPIALGKNFLTRFLLAINSALIGINPGLFSYQIFVIAEPTPSLEILLQRAVDESVVREKSIAAIQP